MLEEDKDMDLPPPYPQHAPIRPQPPPSGYRIPLNTFSAFPNIHYTGEAPCHDADGISPVFIGSAILSNSVHPCKVGPRLSPPCRVPYGGQEIEHQGRYDLLPFDPETMEWVPTSLGRIPDKREPVQGGYEENGSKLYHAMATVRGVRVPGKTGEHLAGCNVAFDCREHIITRGYEILCWKRPAA